MVNNQGKACEHQDCTQRTNDFKNGCRRFRDVLDCGDRVVVEVGKQEKSKEQR